MSKTPSGPASTAPTELDPSDYLTDSGLIRPLSAKQLLAPPARQQLLQLIWQMTSLPEAHFKSLYMEPIERYAELVQLLPASENHHHAHLGGMLDHGLEIIAYALKLRRSYLLPQGAPPEEQSAQAEAWTAGAAYGALCHDIGKIAVDMDVTLASGKPWHPWHGSIREPYRVRYIKGRDYHAHAPAGALLVSQILTPYVLDWLSHFPALFGALLSVLAGHNDRAGILGEIIIKADQASVAANLGGNPGKAITAPKSSLQSKLLGGLRFLLQQGGIRFNQPGAAAYLTEDTLWLVSKAVVDQLKAHLLQQGIEGIPSSNSRLFDEMQAHGLVQPTSDGRSIWKCQITVEGKDPWTQSLTLLKVAPSLIWENSSDRPAVLKGTVVPEHTDAGTGAPDKITAPDATTAQPAVTAFTLDDLLQSTTSSVLPDSTTPTTAAATQQIETAAVMTRQEMTGAVPSASQPPSADATDVMLSLFDQLMPAAAQVATPAPAPSAPRPPESPAAPLEPVVATPEIPHADNPKIFTNSRNLTPETNTNAPEKIKDTISTHFVTWIRQGVSDRSMITNDSRALVHGVDNTVLLVTPTIFTKYLAVHPEVTMDWRELQVRFQQLGIHRKAAGNGENIWTCYVNGPRKTGKSLKGYLLLNPTDVAPNIRNNPFLTLAPERVAEGEV
ncbi:MobH family relaxase [Pokkaliibacter sp. MBI-7]|uniref:MobH family relaxase n=1 Tax=Pokkaliibacter sp. MBI-7 TaxID=3040600 RepID=UPI00244C7C2F|nr:MobH family relaxase [Pokkaliibacter sp. MBI-7]MDH2431092.1 MobH family relaxase [Pokkaliibacter sp. MBI-7]